MAVVTIPKEKPKSPKSGVALLISLSIVTLLSIALMTAFENRTVEVAHLENSLERFQAEALSRSVLRATLLAIRQQGLAIIVKNKQTWQNLPIPIQNGSFKIQEIQPIDHLFNLSKKFRLGSPEVTVFKNIVKKFHRDDNYATAAFDEEQVLSAINDWTDVDQEPDEEFLYGFEQYPFEEPAYEVKNRPFDLLSELKLIPAFRKLNLSDKYVAENFRVIDSREYLNINLAENEEVYSFLDRFDDVEGYEMISTYRDELAAAIAGSESDLLPGLVAKSRFLPPLYQRYQSDWEMALGDEIAKKLTQREKELFDLKTDHLRIRYRISVGRVNLDVESLVKVEYLKPKEGLEIKEFRILSFVIL